MFGWPGPVTYRQYLTWMDWLRAEYDVPSRADYYAMQIASAIARQEVKPLRFNKPEVVDGPVPLLTKESIAKAHTAIAKHKTMRAVMGRKGKHDRNRS